MKKIIGFAGKAGAGKDTAADFLVEKYRFAKYPFAAPLKRGIEAMLGWDVFIVQGKEDPIPGLGGISPRFLAQTLGTEWGRQIVDENFWLTLWLWNTQGRRDSGLPIVVPDVRFRNEVWLIETVLGGDVIYIHRDGTFLPEGGASFHESETQDLVTRRYLFNDGSKERLFKRVDQIVNPGV